MPWCRSRYDCRSANLAQPAPLPRRLDSSVVVATDPRTTLAAEQRHGNRVWPDAVAHPVDCIRPWQHPAPSPSAPCSRPDATTPPVRPAAISTGHSPSSYSHHYLESAMGDTPGGSVGVVGWLRPCPVCLLLGAGVVLGTTSARRSCSWVCR